MGVHERESQNLEGGVKRDYTPFVNIDKRGYWFGSEYQGPYHARLEISTEPLVKILRTGNFPPIVIAAEGFSPDKPDEVFVEGVEPGGGAYMGRGQKHTFKRGNRSRDDKFFSLETMEETRMDFGSDTSVGWKIKMSGDKIFNAVNREEKEVKFGKIFSREIRNALLSVSLMESMGVRMDGISRSGEYCLQLFWNRSNLANWLSTNSPLHKVLKETLDNAIDYPLIVGLQRVFFGKEPIKNSRGIRNNGLFVSDEWRKQYFPKEHAMEASKKAIYLRNRLATSPLPLSNLLHSTYATWVSMQVNRQPLFQIAKNNFYLGV
jgi:hypothetical protein